MSRRADSATTEGEAGPKPEPKKSPGEEQAEPQPRFQLNRFEALA